MRRYMSGISVLNSLLTSLQKHKKGIAFKQGLSYIVIGIILALGSTTAFAWLHPPDHPPIYDPTNGTISSGDIFRSPSSSDGGNSTAFTMKGDGTVSIYRVQVAAYPSFNEAMQIKEKLNHSGVKSIAIETSSNGQWYRVKAGPWPSWSQATATLNLIRSLKHQDAYIVTTDIPLVKANTLNLPLKKTLYRQTLAKAKLPKGNIYSVYSTGLRKWLTATEPTDWIGALPQFTQVIKGNINATLKSESHYFIGEIYRRSFLKTSKQDKNKRTEYAEAAIDAFTEYVNLYPHASKAASAQLKIGYCEHAISDYRPEKLQKAAVAYQKVFVNYSNSPEAAEANLQYAGVLFELAKEGNVSWVNWNLVRGELNKVKNYYPNGKRSIKSRATAMLAEINYYEHNFSQMHIDAKQAISDYSEVTADVVLNNYLIGRALLEMHNYAGARDQFDYLLNTFPESISSDPMVKLSREGALFAKEICLYRLNGNYDEYHRAILQFIHDHPESPEAKKVAPWMNHLP